MLFEKLLTKNDRLFRGNRTSSVRDSGVCGNDFKISKAQSMSGGFANIRYTSLTFI